MTGSRQYERWLCCLLTVYLVNSVTNDDVVRTAEAANEQGDALRELTGVSLDRYLRHQIMAIGLTGNARSGLELPDIKTPRIAQLGRELFFSKSLSGDFDVACASCHHPLLGGADALSLPVGVGAIDTKIVEPDRQHNGDNTADPLADGGPNVARNSPTTFNVALYRQAFFYDGRVQVLPDSENSNQTGEAQGNQHSLMDIQTTDSRFGNRDPEAGDDLVVAQSRFPLAAQSEMRGHSHRFSGTNAHVREILVRRLRGETSELQKNLW